VGALVGGAQLQSSEAHALEKRVDVSELVLVLLHRARKARHTVIEEARERAPSFTALEEEKLLILGRRLDELSQGRDT
jgi:hypothetical protein